MKITTYSDAQIYLESLIQNIQNKRFTNMRLERIEHLLQLIDNPHHTFKSVHVGGTSGKGSTAYLISRILNEAGYQTGLHISPHLQTINERMQINNQAISDEEFITLVNWIKPYAQKVGESNPFGVPSYFEVLVALSFEYFKRKKVDIAIIEVGLGGTLDATNVINPLIAVITNVDLDHTEILGDTIEKIAADKSGIIKNNTDVITAAKQKTVVEIIQKKCLEENAPLLIIRKGINYQIKQSTIEGSLFDLKTNNRHYRNLKLSLLGRHQVENAACAIATYDCLKQRGFTINETSMRTALSTAQFSGRIEIVQQKPLIILDGAHNPAKMHALVQTMQKLFHQKVITVIGFKKKKDIDAMITALLPITKRFIITTFSTMTDLGNNWSIPPSEIYTIIRKYNEFIPCDSISIVQKTIEYVHSSVSPNEIILITGSLYLVGEARTFLRR